MDTLKNGKGRERSKLGNGEIRAFFVASKLKDGCRAEPTLWPSNVKRGEASEVPDTLSSELAAMGGRMKDGSSTLDLPEERDWIGHSGLGANLALEIPSPDRSRQHLDLLEGDSSQTVLLDLKHGSSVLQEALDPDLFKSVTQRRFAGQRSDSIPRSPPELASDTTTRTGTPVSFTTGPPPPTDDLVSTGNWAGNPKSLVEDSRDTGVVMIELEEDDESETNNHFRVRGRPN